MTGSEDPVPDGRTAIRDRNREAVIDAVLVLFAEGDVSPSPEAAAAQAGLSVRSVYRYFEDRDALVRAAIARRLETVAPIYGRATQTEGPLGRRISRLVSGRLDLFAAVGSTYRVGRTRASFDPVVAEQMESGRRTLRDQVAAQFAPELDALPPGLRRDRLDACDVLLQLATIDLLDRMGRAPDEATAVLTGALTALLGPATDA